MHDHHGVEAGQYGHVLLHLVGVEMRELVDAGVQQEALEAEDAIVVQAAQVAGVAGDGTAQKPTSMCVLPEAAARLASSASTLTVGGIELSGMSISVVTPPAAAAR